MSIESTELLWDESIKELQNLVEAERSIDTSKQVSINDAHNHFAKLYIRYSIVLTKLKKVYELTVQPQKRSDIKSTLVHIICRVVNIRHLLVKWAPPNPDVLSKNGQQQPFSWEYTELNQILRELKAVPSDLGNDTPSFFKEETLDSCRDRNALVLKLLKEKYGDELPKLESKEWIVQATDPTPAITISAPVEDEASADVESDSDESETDDEKENIPSEVNETLAAIKIQAHLRSYSAKKKADSLRQWLGTFVGMKSDDNQQDRDNLIKNLSDVHRKRKQEQSYCQEKYVQDLTRLKDVVKCEEGFRMEIDLKEERMKWIADQVVQTNTIPDSFEGFYAKDEPTTVEEKELTKKDQKSKDSKKRDGESKVKVAPVEIELPSIAPIPAMLDSLTDCIDTYRSRWQQRNVGMDLVRSKYYDEELAKDLIIRDQVKLELAAGVEDKLLSNLLKIKAMEDASKKKSKSKKDTKGKKGTRKKAGGKGKKEKPLPGAKLPGMKEMDAEEMLRELVDHGLVCIPAQHALNDLIGGHESQPPKVAVAKDNERWIPRDPSVFQLKRAIYDYCILSLGSRQIQSNLQDGDFVRSLLLYGPEGSGKTLMTQAIASELGALFINLSPTTIGNAFGGKEGATKLVHMIFTVAKEKSFGPVVICLDDCHEFFMGKIKKGGTAHTRFQKDLLIYKNQALTKEDRVLVIGCTNRPELADVKLLRWKGAKGKAEKQGFFERSLYFPRANHADRSLLWRECIQRRMSPQKVPSIDYEALAVLSDGYSAAEIESVVASAISHNRLKEMGSKALSERDFTSLLSQRKPNDEVFLNFTRQITKLDARYKQLKGPPKIASTSKK